MVSIQKTRTGHNKTNVNFSNMLVWKVLSLVGILVHFKQTVCDLCPPSCRCQVLNSSRIDIICSKLNLHKFRITKTSNLKIKAIYLDGNNLEFLVGIEIKRYAPNLWLLDLNQNRFDTIEYATFESCSSLEVLYFANNRIERIESNSFSDLSKLKKLYLSGNKLQVVKDIWFRNLLELDFLDLSKNFISEFAPSYFRWPERLETLLLQNNSFLVLPPIPKKVNLMNLRYNVIDCSCQRRNHESVDKNVLLKVQLTCTKLSTETWRKQHWDNPYCTYPTVHVEYRQEADGTYSVTCTGNGFPHPTVTVKYAGLAVTNTDFKNKVIYGPVRGLSVRCSAKNVVGYNETVKGHVLASKAPHDQTTQGTVLETSTVSEVVTAFETCYVSQCHLPSYSVLMLVSCFSSFFLLLGSIYLFCRYFSHETLLYAYRYDL